MASKTLETEFFLVVALLLSVLVCAQTASVYICAYLNAPIEVLSFVDACDSSVQENESYDLDIMKIQRMEDKMRLTRLYRDIQRSGDDLREELNKLLLGEDGGTRLRFRARMLWKSKREVLEAKIKRSDMLRMRFLVVYFGLVARGTPDPKFVEKSETILDVVPVAKKEFARPKGPQRPNMHKALTDEILRHPPLRRLSTQAMGHTETVGPIQKGGWLGVVEELQRSPKMKLRHASIESAMGRSPTGEKKFTLPSW